MINDIIYWLSVLGSIASLVGLPIAIWQIRKTRRVAEAARDASDRTQKTISQNLLLSNIHTCTKIWRKFSLSCVMKDMNRHRFARMI